MLVSSNAVKNMYNTNNNADQHVLRTCCFTAYPLEFSTA